MSIKKVTNAISNGASAFAELTLKHLEGTTVKVVGVLAILIGLGVIGAAAFGHYKFAMMLHMPEWTGIQWLMLGPHIPFVIFTAIPVVLCAGSLFLYGKNMLTAKRIVGPKQSVGEL